VEKEFPEMVLTNAAGYKSVDYSRLTPVLLEAIKEQQDMIEGQQKEIKELQGRLKDMDAMEARLQRIEAALQK
jgi:hypothetical protein